MKEAIFFCMVGLPPFGKEGSGTPVFKILVRTLKSRADQYQKLIHILVDDKNIHFVIMRFKG